jgi:hypothetical protein
MKNILFLIVLVSAFFVVLSCDHNTNPNNNYDDIPLSNIRSVADDPIVGCIVEQVHQHNSNYYSGHYNNDIHGHHGLIADNICPINSCDKTFLHEHNGIHYAGHHGSDSHNSHDNGHH